MPCCPQRERGCLWATRKYMEKVGFKDVRSIGLEDLVRIQKKHMPLRYKIAYKYEYYVIYGLK
ncbi:hypothetical protein [Methanosarcina spelaei]|uniref:hypothetical protein n=1 Tax=Methanosarcina spelaei TaxID=1036679 RepID=UPI001140DBA0|nr:hypothetical protein [Methanosarcina spelaei]